MTANGLPLHQKNLGNLGVKLCKFITCGIFSFSMSEYSDAKLIGILATKNAKITKKGGGNCVFSGFSAFFAAIVFVMIDCWGEGSAVWTAYAISSAPSAVFGLKTAPGRDT